MSPSNDPSLFRKVGDAVAEAIATRLPAKGREVVLSWLQSRASGPELSRLSDSARDAISQLLDEVETGGRFRVVLGKSAITGTLLVGQTTVDVILPDALRDTTRQTQERDAKRLHGRLATRDENIAYVESLLEKEHAHRLNDAEQVALERYRSGKVRDQKGAIYLYKRRIFSHDGAVYDNDAFKSYGALVIREPK